MRTLVTTCCVCLALAAVCGAKAPTLQKGVKIEVAGEPVDIEIGHLVPSVADFNADGKKDLIIGQFKSGRISLCLNTGTDAAPTFKEIKQLKADGELIKLDAG